MQNPSSQTPQLFPNTQSPLWNAPNSGVNSGTGMGSGGSGGSGGSQWGTPSKIYNPSSVNISPFKMHRGTTDFPFDIKNCLPLNRSIITSNQSNSSTFYVNCISTQDFFSETRVMNDLVYIL